MNQELLTIRRLGNNNNVFDNLIRIDTQKHIGQTNHAEQINYQPVPMCT